MTISIGQVTYNLQPPQADPGQLNDASHANRIESFTAAETIQPGRLLELAADGVSVQQVQGTGNAVEASAVGFSILITAKEGLGNNNVVGSTGGAAFNAGETVPVLRRGSMFAEWKGTTQTAYGVPNVYHSSTLAADRGKLTDASTSAGAGTEVSNCPHTVQVQKALPGAGNIVLIEVNMPGAS